MDSLSAIKRVLGIYVALWERVRTRHILSHKNLEQSGSIICQYSCSTKYCSNIATLLQRWNVTAILLKHCNIAVNIVRIICKY